MTNNKKQTDAKPDGREAGNAVPPAPVSDPLQAKMDEAVDNLKKNDPKTFENLQIMVAGHLVGEAVQNIIDIPDEAFKQLITFAGARKVATADAVAFTAEVLLEAKNKLSDYATNNKHRVIEQIGEQKIRDILKDDKAADEFLKPKAEKKG